uniref:Uncharacterized protein n=1 Tax=Meloidogyne enterolobii TaxID=390850 RepID=A0A6V7XCE3_MELEN|nr:unnamed protein product [Meloidogyne enterolobii]
MGGVWQNRKVPKEVKALELVLCIEIKKKLCIKKRKSVFKLIQKLIHFFVEHKMIHINILTKYTYL